MALSNSVLKDLIIAECQAQGFVTTGPHAQIEKLAEAIANAVVSHVTSAAVVTVTSGSSAGPYKVS